MTRKKITMEQRASSLSNLDALLAATNAMGKEQLTRLNGTTGRWPNHKIIRTGSLELDMCIGIGGLPRGRICEIYGQESSGKTTLFLHVVAEAQRQGMNVLYIDAESALDPNYCQKLGVDLDLWLINQPDSLESAIDLMAAAMGNSMSADTNDLLIVLDSIPALAAQVVHDTSAEQQTRALNARHWSAQMPKLTKLARQSNSTILLINQMRESMDMYTPASTPGGKAIKFAASVRIALKRDVEGKKNEGGSDGQFGTIDVVKNKVGSPFKKGSFWLPKGGPIIWEKDVIDTCMAWGEVVYADSQFVDGELISKKGWFALELKKGWLDLIRQDELVKWLEFNDLSDDDGNLPDGDGLHTEENFDSEWLDETEVIQAYRLSKFTELISVYPSLIEAMEEALLDTLNTGIPVDDVEAAVADLVEA